MTTPGASVRVITWATNAVMRYPGKQWQPYAGVGIGVFFARANLAGITESDNAVPGLNAFTGLRFFPTEHLAVFTEYKYNRATFDFPTVLGLETVYSVHHVLGGVSVHF